MKRFILALVLSVAPLGACATSATVTQAPLSAGISQDFHGSFETVREAARASVQSDLPVAIRGVEERGGAYIINYEIGVSAFSWGEVGRVVVTLVDADTTRVTLHNEKRYQVQVTGQGERRLATQLFEAVQRRLQP